MNGWQRLYVVLAGLCALGIGALYASSYPDTSAGSVVWACDGLVERDVTPHRAREYLRVGLVPESDRFSYPQGDLRIEGDCANELQHVANGTLLESKRAEWWGEARKGAGWFLATASIVYLMGMALGWVWRGFFPKKPVSLQ